MTNIAAVRQGKNPTPERPLSKAHVSWSSRAVAFCRSDVAAGVPTAAAIAEWPYSAAIKEVMLIDEEESATRDCLNLAPGVVIVISPQPPIRGIAGCHLWVGPSAVLDDPRAICDLGIEAVVCVAPEPLPADWPRDLTFARVPLTDGGENRVDSLRRALDIVCGLIRDNVPTLVVCSMGQSRSVAVAAAAIATYESVPPDDVLRRITAGQPADVSPALWDALKRIH